MFETFVESQKHKDTCLQGGQLDLGKTVGRDKKGTSHLQVLPTKDIWLYPLRRDNSTALRAYPSYLLTEFLLDFDRP
jgi:hypothetical protein